MDPAEQGQIDPLSDDFFPCELSPEAREAVDNAVAMMKAVSASPPPSPPLPPGLAADHELGNCGGGSPVVRSVIGDGEGLATALQCLLTDLMTD